jgi:hypothetical protein
MEAQITQPRSEDLDLRYCNVIAAISMLKISHRHLGFWRKFKNHAEAYEFAFNMKAANPEPIAALITEFEGSLFSLGMERNRLRRLIDRGNRI